MQFFWMFFQILDNNTCCLTIVYTACGKAKKCVIFFINLIKQVKVCYSLYEP